jgi:RimJ/RimL family protein N-acetyltransferase
MRRVLCTPLFELRPLSERDRETYIALYTDAGVMSHIGPSQDAVSAERDFHATLRALADGACRKEFWTLVEPGQNDGIGLIGLVRDDQGGSDLGIVIFTSRQGRSYAAYAIAAVANHAFDHLGLHMVRTRHTAANARTEGLMHKLGFLPDANAAGSQDLRWQLTPGQWSRRRSAWTPD